MGRIAGGVRQEGVLCMAGQNGVAGAAPKDTWLRVDGRVSEAERQKLPETAETPFLLWTAVIMPIRYRYYRPLPFARELPGLLPLLLPRRRRRRLLPRMLL